MSKTWNHNQLMGIGMTGNSDKENTIVVTAVGNAFTEPDVATLEVGVIKDAMTSSEAMSKNAECMNAILKELKKLNIDDKDMKTNRLSLTPMYSDQTKNYYYFDNIEKPTILCYRAANSIMINIKDLSKISSIIDSAYLSGANNISSVCFSVSEDKASELFCIALEKAVKNGAEKVRRIASVAGIKNFELKTISEPQYSNSYQSGMLCESSEISSSQTPIMSGQESAQASVTMVYSFKRG